MWRTIKFDKRAANRWAKQRTMGKQQFIRTYSLLYIGISLLVTLFLCVTAYIVLSISIIPVGLFLVILSLSVISTAHNFANYLWDIFEESFRQYYYQQSRKR
jgi:hypothetical protein